MYAVERLGEDSGSRCFSCAPRTDKEIGVGQTLPLNGILQCLSNMVLPENIVEILGPIFACEDLVTHGSTLFTMSEPSQESCSWCPVPDISMPFAPAEAGSVGCFSKRSEPDWQQRRAYLNRYVRSEPGGRRTEKQPTGHAPEGCDENGSAAVRRPPDRLHIALDMRPLSASPARTALPAAVLIATKDMLISGTGHWLPR